MRGCKAVLWSMGNLPGTSNCLCSSARGGALYVPLPSMLVYWLAWSCAGLAQAAACVQQPCHVQPLNSPSWPLATAVSLLPLQQRPLNLAERIIAMSVPFKAWHPQSLTLYTLASGVSVLTIGHCKKKLLWLGVKAALIMGIKISIYKAVVYCFFRRIKSAISPLDSITYRPRFLITPYRWCSSTNSPVSTSLLPFFFFLATLTGIGWNLSVFFSCISLMVKDGEYLYIFFLAICISSLENSPFSSIAHFQLCCLFSQCSAFWVLCII